MSKQKIRPLAICVFRDGERIFAAEGYDSLKQQTFYRPLGGRIEFGERSDQTIVRELREEIGAEVSDLRYLGTLENIFTFNGEAGHEIVLVYDGKFVDKTIYEREGLEGVEESDEHAGTFRAVWKSLSFFREGRVPLYPDGLLELLEGKFYE
jgi:8-oxo-dGTP pyrophosphatase MutT (NUDIX family)